MYSIKLGKEENVLQNGVKNGEGSSINEKYWEGF